MRRTCLFGLGLPKFSILLGSLLELLIIITVLYAKNRDIGSMDYSDEHHT